VVEPDGSSTLRGTPTPAKDAPLPAAPSAGAAAPAAPSFGTAATPASPPAAASEAAGD
jgi:hypothetical protein